MLAITLSISATMKDNWRTPGFRPAKQPLSASGKENSSIRLLLQRKVPFLGVPFGAVIFADKHKAQYLPTWQAVKMFTACIITGDDGDMLHPFCANHVLKSPPPFCIPTVSPTHAIVVPPPQPASRLCTNFPMHRTRWL
ncbi:hypothetical protein BG74_00150 [Sodalis-like endosymbiont of Proechinophthirus fluctus]|nr:hypothetical protein BG74_00150 [Sodalis-like endosymbiont of Proechinophthirus fluctus]